MNDSFATNSPSTSKGNSSAGGGGGSTNRTKFPFILMPVSNVGDRRTLEECDLVLPSIHRELPVQSQHDPNTKAARRNTIIQKELRSRFPSSRSNEDEVCPHEQLRRSARALYPTSNSVTQLSLAEDGYLPSTNPGATLLFNGFPMPREQFQGMVLPRMSSRSRTSKFRTPRNNPEDNETLLPLASVSCSTPQLAIGRQVTGDGIEMDSLKQESVDLKNQLSLLDIKLQGKDNEVLTLKKELTSLKETMEKSVYEAQTSKAQQATLRHEFARLEQQLESLEDRFESYDDLASLKEFIVSQSTSNQAISSKPPLPKSPDFDRIINMIRELNSIAGNYQSVELCYTNGGATFKPPDAIVLTLYRNGITLDDCDAFRPFDALSTVTFIQDIYDGYFPTELQSKYPEGITLVVKDRRQTFHPGDVTFKGKGRKLNERVEFLPKFLPNRKTSPKKAKEQPRERKVLESKGIGIHAAPVVSLPDLLPSTTCLTKTQRALYKTVANKFITLKLKNLKSEVAYKLKTTTNVTPDEILLHLETHLEPISQIDDPSFRKYELINSFPFGIFSLANTCLREYGITSNALIYFRPI